MKRNPMFSSLVAKGDVLIEFLVMKSKAIRMKKVTIKQAGTKEFLQFIPHTSAILGLLTAAEYFSGKPNPNIGLHPPNPQGFYLDTDQEFYEVNKLEIPEPEAKIFELFI
jgi:hypothetical protein